MKLHYYYTTFLHYAFKCQPFELIKIVHSEFDLSIISNFNLSSMKFLSRSLGKIVFFRIEFLRNCCWQKKIDLSSFVEPNFIDDRIQNDLKQSFWMQK
jgi:hypothetical protein